MVIKKIYNNNIVLVEDENQREMILQGRGLAFGKKAGDSIEVEKAEKRFVIDSPDLTSKFTELMSQIPANHLELERLEIMLNYLNAHFDSVVKLQELADQVHLSREVCCRLFRKLTGKTVTGYLEEYRAAKSVSLVQSGQYSMTQIADMIGFSNASRFAAAFRRQFGCNPGEYHSFTAE